MKKEYIYLILSLIIIWILGFLLFLPQDNRPESGISEEASSTSIQMEGQ